MCAGAGRFVAGNRQAAALERERVSREFEPMVARLRKGSQGPVALDVTYLTIQRVE